LNTANNGLVKDFINNFNIYTGRDEDKHHIFTPYLSFFNFDNYKEAQEMCDKLNRIADKYHENR